MGKKIKCHLCGREWDYKGKSTKYVTCPNCMSKIKIDNVNKIHKKK